MVLIHETGVRIPVALLSMKFFLACLVLLLVFFSRNTFASSDVSSPSGGEIDEAIAKFPPLRFLPGEPLYPLIATKENFYRFFKASALERAQFDFMLSSKRLKESFELLENGKDSKAADNFERYTEKINDLIGQINKAKSQNQDIVALGDNIAAGLEFQEHLISYFVSKDTQSSSDAESSFVKLVYRLEEIKPGYKNRFSLTKELEEKTAVEPSPEPTPSPLPSPDYSPRRVIY